MESAATSIAVGVFDGVHLGHQAVLREAVARAAAGNLMAAAVTFDPHPDHVLHPQHAPELLTTLSERAALIAESGMEVMLVLRFDRTLARLTPEQFVRQVVVEQLGARCVVAGEGFRFGRGGQGDIYALIELGRQLGFRVVAVKGVMVDGVTVSSTAVRDLIRHGDIERATAFLGHYYTIGGRVVRGHRRGRAIGVPTANLCVEHGKLLPPHGVYAVRARIEGQATPLPAVANIGMRPTFTGRARHARESVGLCVEAHFLGPPTPDNLYGCDVTLEVVSRLREERVFANPDALAAQIQRDIARARRILARE